MKVKAILIVILLIVTVFSGCSKKPSTNNSATDPTAAVTTAPTVSPSTAATTPPTSAATATKAPTTAPSNTTPDAVTTASIVDNQEAFMKAISKTGTWIIAITKDLTIDKELLVEGEFKNGKKDDAGKDLIQRKIALYSQDANRTITARYTLTAPKMTISSPMASIQHGTFKGDVVVTVTDFQLIDATVDGNVYFTTQAVKDSFKMDDTSKITGKQEVQ